MCREVKGVNCGTTTRRRPLALVTDRRSVTAGRISGEVSEQLLHQLQWERFLLDLKAELAILGSLELHVGLQDYQRSNSDRKGSRIEEPLWR